MPKRKNGSGLLRKRADGRWEGRVVVGYDENNLPITKNVTSNSKSECQQKLGELIREYANTAYTIENDITFGKWIDFIYRNFRKMNLRPATKENYEYEIYKYIIPKLGDIRVKDLKAVDFENLYRELKEKNYSDRLIKGCHMLCKSALEDAVKEGIIQKNPVKTINPKNPKPKKVDVLSSEEMQRFLIQAKYEGCFELFITALSTGIRRGEILGLKWSDLNLKTGEFYIQRQVQRINGELVVSPPKTQKSKRTIIIPKSLLQILTEYKKTQNSEWIFPSPVKENSPRDPAAIYKTLQRILKRAECHKIRFHDLRHTFATMAIDGGMDIKTLSDMIGHTSVSTTLDVYLHSTDKMKQEAASKINGIFEKDGNVTPKSENKAPKTIFEPVRAKRRRAGTGCIHKINDNLYEGRISVKEKDKKRSKCVYAKTKKECEEKLQMLIKSYKVTA